MKSILLIVAAAAAVISVSSFVEARTLANKLSDGTQVASRFQRSARILRSVLSQDHARRKRELSGKEDEEKAGEDISNLATIMCQSACLEDMTGKMGEFGDTDFSIGIGSNLTSLFNDTFFQQFCDSSTEMKSCFQSCGQLRGPMAFFGETISKLRGIIDFICVDHRKEFEDALPCYQKAGAELERQCDAQCDPSSKSAKADAANGAGMKNIDEDCKYLSCAAQCQTPILLQQCNGDPKPGQLLHDWIKMCINTGREILESLPAEFRLTVPESCNFV